MGFFSCDHTWEIIVDKTLPPPLDQTTWGKIKGDWSGFAETHIVILACVHCGKLNKTKTLAGERYSDS